MNISPVTQKKKKNYIGSFFLLWVTGEMFIPIGSGVCLFDRQRELGVHILSRKNEQVNVFESGT